MNWWNVFIILVCLMISIGLEVGISSVPPVSSPTAIGVFLFFIMTLPTIYLSLSSSKKKVKKGV